MEVLYNYKADTYFVKEKYDGQTYYMGFECGEGDGNVCAANIVLYVLTKKKHYDDVMENNITSTGKHPFHTYKFCKEAYEALEKEFIESETRKGCYKKLIIYCHWLDNRRRNAYEKFLSRYGFTYQNYWGKKCLAKNISIQ